MSYYKSMSECWQDASQRAESLPAGTRTISKIGIAAMDYIMCANAEQFRPIAEKMYIAEQQLRIMNRFHEELERFETPFGNIEAAIEQDVLDSANRSDIERGE